MKENNKLLAEFLRLQTIEFHSNLYLATKEDFDLMDSLIWNPRLDWNDLMRVIEKIYELDIEKCESIVQCIPNMNYTYNACVKFVQNYGKNFN